MTDSNRISIGYGIEDVEYGTPPAGSGKWRQMRSTSESLHQETSSTSSAELRSDRQVPAVTRTNLSVAGDTAWELSFDDVGNGVIQFNRLLESAIMDDGGWSTKIVTSGHSGFVITEATNRVQTGSSSGTLFSNFQEGEWIRITGMSKAGNNGIFKIKTKVSSQDIYLEGATAEYLEDETDTTATAERLAQIVNGVAQSSYTIERIYEDITSGDSGRCASYGGMMIDTMNITVAPESIITGSFGWIGKSETSLDTETEAVGQHDAANANDPMNSIDNVPKVMEGAKIGDDTGTNVFEYTGYVTSNVTGFSITTGNNLRTRMEIGTLGAVSIGSGVCNVSGTITKYYANKNMMEKYLDFTESSLAIITQDTDGNAYVFDFPSVKFTSGQRVAGGQNQDIIADMAWEALMNPVEGITMRIAKYEA